MTPIVRYLNQQIPYDPFIKVLHHAAWSPEYPHQPSHSGGSKRDEYRGAQSPAN